MKRTLASILIALIATAVPAIAQARTAVVRIAAFTGDGIAPGEIDALERLVASYVAELGAFRVVDDGGRELALSETETALLIGAAQTTGDLIVADYVLGGTLGKIGDFFVFTLENTKVATGEKLIVSDTAHSINDIVVRARALTRSLFGKRDDATGIKPMATLLDLAGSWRGDKGIETVRLFADGTGIAILSAGGSIRVKVAISGDTVVVRQDQPNDPAMYRSAAIGPDVAKRIAALARPMVWIFALSADGASLSGIKESIAVTGSGESLKVDNGFTREASWTRLSR